MACLYLLPQAAPAHNSERSRSQGRQPQKTLTTATLPTVATNLPVLSIFRFFLCLRYSSCKRLSGVRLENSLQLREANLSDNVSLLRAVLLGSGLEMLKMSHCTQLQEVELTCPSLKYVQMERSRVLSGSVFNQLNACRQLDSVVVNGGYQVMEIDLELPLLRRADFSGCNHVWRVNIRCPTLESLVLPGRKATISDVKIRCAHDASITPEHPEWAVTVTQSIKEFSYPL